MTNILLVGIGGFVGSVSRYLLGGWIFQLTAPGRFPTGTFVVNICGCLLIGILTALGDRYETFTPEVRLLIFTGLLGGFTTFSAFSAETVVLLRRGDPWTAAAYVIASVCLGLAAVAIGMRAIPLPPG